ncbi:hypothetical protein FOZ60_012949 [Perkinsus olseni]|uniref:PABS domain-containing protein n=1 Tax=Perkinsus olseni TaxID=32597 RepID=A0A7J6PAH3_PEROL|nr:hypothetical protein FOZ60_012949 [Perkinsus olseni]
MVFPSSLTPSSDISTYAAVGVGGVLLGGLIAAAYTRCTPSNEARRDKVPSIPQLPTEDGRVWFSEVSDEMWPGQSMSLEISKVLYHKRSRFQDIMVFDSTKWGRVLCLDGVFQTTDKDEFCYQEAMAHTPAFLHPSPKKVLVIGGGDGGILRELAKHKSITELHICEIDGQVIEVSKRIHEAIIHLEDGAAFMKRHSNEFDIIVCDTSDPVGPAKTLFENDFYDAIYNALTPNGVAATQGECYHLSIPLIRRLVDHSRKHFADVRYADVRIPTYPCGQIGCLVLVKGKGVRADEPVRAVPKEMAGSLKYYSSKLHRTQFTLPARLALLRLVTVMRCLTMVAATIYLMVFVVQHTDAVFPPNASYCSKTAQVIGFEWALSFPRKPDFLKNTMSIHTLVNHTQVNAYGIPIAEFTFVGLTFIKVDVTSEHFHDIRQGPIFGC